jgi:hypothetical protein
MPGPPQHLNTRPRTTPRHSAATQSCWACRKLPPLNYYGECNLVWRGLAAWERAIDGREATSWRECAPTRDSQQNAQLSHAQPYVPSALLAYRHTLATSRGHRKSCWCLFRAAASPCSHELGTYHGPRSTHKTALLSVTSDDLDGSGARARQPKKGPKNLGPPWLESSKSTKHDCNTTLHL